MTEEFEEIDFENVKVTFPDNSTKKYPKPQNLNFISTKLKLKI